jgi:tetratricopeptide (TPR) repeat protein
VPQRAGPRCLACGRRWVGPHPACPAPEAPPPRADDRPAPRPALAGYRIERLIGEGGFGAVYLARPEAGGRLIALKIDARPTSADGRLLREGRALRLVGPPHVPELFFSGALSDGRPFLAMEHVELPLLADRLADLPEGMPLDELEARAAALFGALRAVHAHGIVHRDLKPENVFMSDPVGGIGVARIFDFGLIGRLADEASQSATTAGRRGVAGTSEYMGPEQCEPGLIVDARSDIYAVGVMLYEMITGRTPFWGNAAEVQQNQLHRRPPRPSELVPTPPAIEEVVLRCLAKDPDRRFESTEALAEGFTAAVARARSQRGIVPTPAPRAAAVRKGPGHQRRPMVILLLQGACDPVKLRETLAATGGDLAQVGRGSCVAVFGQKTSENPIRRALRVAESLLHRGLGQRALLDLGSVAVQRRPDGGERFVSTAFSRIERQLGDGDPQGIFMTAVVADLTEDRRGEPLPGRPGIVSAHPARGDQEELITVIRAAESPLIGRAEELDHLLASAGVAVQQGTPTIATVVAEAGHGKSYFCATLVRLLRERLKGAEIVELRASQPMGGDADESLRSLLRRCLNLPVASPDDRGQALLTRLLDRDLWPPAAMALGWIPPDAPELRALGAAPGVLRAMVVRSAGEALRRLAARRPLILILDDAHYADQATTDAIEYATLAEAAAPLWACVLAPPAFEEGRPAWAERSAARVRVHLGPLPRAAAVELCRELLRPAENVPADTLEALVAGTQGSPLLLTELVRALKRDGLVRRDATTGEWFLASDELEHLPDLPLVEWLAERELGALPPDLAAHARLAALLGAEFSETEIDAVLGGLDRQGLAADFPLDARIATRKLLANGLLVQHRRDSIGFRHALVREAVSSSVPPALRVQVHRAAFLFYREAAQIVAEAERLPRLAFHAAKAGLTKEAAALYLQLAEAARSRHAYLDAEALYTQALQLLPEGDDRRRMIAWRGRGLMRYRVSRHDSIDDLALARGASQRLGDHRAEVDIVLDASTAFDWTDEYRKSRALVGEAEAMARAGRPPASARPSDLIAARVLLAQGRAMWRFSERREALEKLTEAVALAERLGDEGYETLVVSLLLLGDLLPWYGETERAERAFERVIALCRRHGDRVHLAVALLNRRQIWIARRDLGKALEDTTQCIQIARELGLGTTYFMGSYNLGEMFYQAGDVEAAWPHVLRAVELERKRFSGVGRPVARLLQARLLAFEGNHDSARTWVDEICGYQARIAARGTTEGMLLPSEDVLLAMVDLCTRDAARAEWDELRRRAEKVSVEQELIEVTEMEARWLMRQGRPAEARLRLAEAERLAVRIPNLMKARLQRGFAALAESAPVDRTHTGDDVSENTAGERAASERAAGERAAGERPTLAPARQATATGSR